MTGSRGLRQAVSVAVATCLLALGAAPAQADEEPEPLPTTTTLTGPEAKAGQISLLDIAVATEGEPLAEAPVLLERRVGGTWQDVTTLLTDAEGHASHEVTMLRVATDNVFRAGFAGDSAHQPSTSGPVRIGLLRHDTRIALKGPDSVIDERRVRLKVVWRTLDGTPVPGRVRLKRREDGRWKTVRRGRTGERGITRFRVRPREDARFRVAGLRQAWVHRAASPTHRIDNLPPGDPVALPAGAPEPRISVPPQPRPRRAGPNAVIRRIPDGVWRHMVGRSWHKGCPVGRSGLRLLRINYWDYDGYRRRGEVVARVGAAGQIAAALKEMYRRKLPIRSMYRVDRFGWSKKLNGANDYRSMAAGNTSAFNCRDVVGRPGVQSPHSYGRSFDVNPWENPYRTSTTWLPNGWWVGRSHPRVAWRSHDHTVVRLMASHGLHWTYGTRDAHHFDAR